MLCLTNNSFRKLHWRMLCHSSKMISKASVLLCVPHLNSGTQFRTNDIRREGGSTLIGRNYPVLSNEALPRYTYTPHWYIDTSSKQRVRLLLWRIPKTLAYYTFPPPPICTVGTEGEGLSIALLSLNSRIPKEAGTPWKKEETEMDMPRNDQPQHPGEAQALKLHRKPLFLCFHTLLVDSTQVTSEGASKQL